MSLDTQRTRKRLPSKANDKAFFVCVSTIQPSLHVTVQTSDTGASEALCLSKTHSSFSPLSINYLGANSHSTTDESPVTRAETELN